jgi:predicted RNA-binding Zn-ribbon protein involved in translation (DUF1610 family)
MSGSTLHETRHAPTPCPWCGYVTDTDGHLTEKVSPETGSIFVCIKCGGIATLRSTGRRERMEGEEFHSLPHGLQNEISRIVDVIIGMNTTMRRVEKGNRRWE